MKLNFNDIEIKQCDVKNLEEILTLQNNVFANLENKEWLRKNTPEMLLDCLTEPNYTIGAFFNKQLIAITVLYVPKGKTDDDNLSALLENVDFSDKQCANYKLCFVDPMFRGNSLQRILETEIEEYAKKNGIDVLCATASPYNEYSTRNIVANGYIFNRRLQKYGFERNLYYKVI